MARVGIIFGLALCSLTVLGMVCSLAKAPSQFFPMMLGIPLLFLGVVALNPHRRKISMQVAAAVATFGVIVGGGRSLYSATRWASGGEMNAFAFKMILAMTVICAVFSVISAVSFIRDRRPESADSIASASSDAP